ncbi:prepilin-type N-terminal cleavage/methylation domain-containing protein [Clostridium magnum]|uniref:Putative major pilin subunit n=1 Tax=Clostridium magnum DSM 2767 TaxID=1121326 RepID=A0A162U3A6_9CLOT|nr:prepilin-type N-terminal cleavage/methylation domain-containing protein [Clostridium magnum]KZL93383.1 putative major pilin subunit [Clostridium magnum DSM 2767]SHI16045.1 type IV pilus assembly protein PilA [Clostridium magnum DSM 2767]
MKRKGFTLIELMIVIAIIAILAVVLIPKSQLFKNQSKNAGVTTNVNTVRGYLETKVSINGSANSYLSGSELNSAMTTAFISNTDNSQKLINPISSSSDAFTVIVDGATFTGTGIPTTSISSSYSVPSVVKSTTYAGQVIVDVHTDGYVVYGIDNAGLPTQVFIVK